MYPDSWNPDPVFQVSPDPDIWIQGFRQGFGSGSGLDPYSIGPVDPDPDPGGQKLPTKVEKIHVLKCWMASFVSWRLLL